MTAKVMDQHELFMAHIEPLRASLLELIQCHRDERANRAQRPVPGSPADCDDHAETAYRNIEGRPTATPRLLGNLQLVAAEGSANPASRLTRLED